MKVYFDAVSTTDVNKEVLETYKQLLDKYYANSDALYDEGVTIYDMQEKSRSVITELLGVKKNELIFTSGASEANSLAIKGLCFKHPERKHLITSIYEHSSVHNSFKQLEENFGYDVTYLMPDENGHITADAVKNALREDTLLVSVMKVNNELGIINDVEEIAGVVKKHRGTYFHTDVTQALAKTDIDFTNIDMASFSAHKIHGLKGSGALIKKQHVELLPIISGGQQEFSIRGGTSNALTNIVLAKTLRLAIKNNSENHQYVKELSDYLKDKLKDVNGVKVNSPDGSIDSLINISTPLTSEVILNALNAKGIMVSSKSTCGTRSNELNRTLNAMNIDENHAIRISFDYTNTKEEIDYFIASIKEIIDKYA